MRRKRLREIVQVNRFEEDLTGMHRKLMDYSTGLSTTSPHYRAINDLAAQIADAMRLVTGREVPWVRYRGNPMDGHRKS